MAEARDDKEPALVERWLQDQQQWQRTLLAYLDSMVKNEDFLVHLGNAMRGSLLAGKPYPTAPPPGAPVTETPSDARLDQLLFELHQTPGAAQRPRHDARRKCETASAPSPRRADGQSPKTRRAKTPGDAGRRRQESQTQGPRVNPSDDDRELEALLGLSRRGRAKLDRLHEILTSGGHYGTRRDSRDGRLPREQASAPSPARRERAAPRRAAGAVRPGAGQPLLHHRPPPRAFVRRPHRRGRFRRLHRGLRRAGQRGSVLRSRVLRGRSHQTLRAEGVGPQR